MGIFDTLRSIVDKTEDALKSAEEKKDEYKKRIGKAVKAFDEDKDEENLDGADHQDSDSKQ